MNKNTKIIIINSSKVLLFIAIIIFSYKRSLKITPVSDFHVFWQAGVDLWQHYPLYETRDGLRSFLYPPFAALFFSPLSVLPFKLATFSFFILNFLMWYLCFDIIHKIVLFYNEQEKIKSQHITFVSFLLSFKFFWNNIMMVQSNILVFLFCLLGVLHYIRNNENKAIMYFAVGTSLKLTPLFFFFWVVFRGNLKTFFKCLFSGFAFIILPFLASGLNRGLLDINWYAENFVLKFLKVKEISMSYANQSLSSALYRSFTTLNAKGEPIYTIWDLGSSSVELIYKVLFITILLSLLLNILLARSKKLDKTFHTPALIILSMLLLSGITWKAHLVSLSLVFALWPLTLNLEKKIERRIWTLITFITIVGSFAGKEIIGDNLQKAIGGYNLYTVIIILLYLFFLFNASKDLSRKVKHKNTN